VTREVQVMALLNHPNIVRYYDSWFDVWALDPNQVDSLLSIGKSVDSSIPLKKLTSYSSSSRSHPPATNLTDGVIYLYIQMELCPTGTLENWLDKHREHRPVIMCVEIFKSIVKAINYLHQNNFMHRDIKVFYNVFEQLLF